MLGVIKMGRYLQSARNITISGRSVSTSNNPEAHSYAAVMVIIERDDEGAISLDRFSFAPGLTKRLI